MPRNIHGPFIVGDKVRGIAGDIIGCEAIVESFRGENPRLRLTAIGNRPYHGRGEFLIGGLIDRNTRWDDCLELVQERVLRVGDRITIRLGNQMPDPHDNLQNILSDGVTQFTIRCVHEPNEIYPRRYHILPGHIRQQVCNNTHNCFIVYDDEVELVMEYRDPLGPFRVGDVVRCIMGVQDLTSNINSDYNGGSGWTEGREFTIRQITDGIGGRKILWPSEFSTGIIADWVVLVTGALSPQSSASPKIIIPDKFTIGSDIEVAFVKGGLMVGSSSVMASSFREDDKHFGTDHGGAVGEFRPEFAWHPMKHCSNLKNSIRKIIEGKNMLEDTYLNSSHIVGSHVVGGHIHFGIKDPVLIEKCKKNLDYWLLPTVQPLFPKDVFMKRVQSGYGKLGGESVRRQDHGFEYRLVPSFIFDEKIAQGIFCLAYTIVKLTIEGKLKVRLEEMDSNWIERFTNDYNNYGLNKLNDLREESIKKLIDKNLLKGLHQYIYPLFEAIKNEKKFSGDIAEGWGMKYQYVLNSGDKEEEDIVFGGSQLQRYIREIDRRRSGWIMSSGDASSNDDI